MIASFYWPAFAALGAAGGTLFLIQWVRTIGGAPGATPFLGVFCVQFVMTASYGIGLFVFDPAVRRIVELLFWITTIWIGTLFLAFALEYTGRGALVESPAYTGTVAISGLLTVLLVTNPYHGLLWTNFGVDAVGGMAGVSYDRNALAIVALAFAFLTAGLGTLLLVDTIASYGALYRSEAIAVAVSVVPPAVGGVLWTFGIEPIAGVNLTPALFLPHVVLDAYAFTRSGLLEFDPATSRAAERSAIDNVRSPVVVVDERGRVVKLNAAAKALFDVDERTALEGSLAEQYGGEPIDPAVPEQTVTIRVDGRLRTFKTSSEPLYGSVDELLGYTIVLQDVTAERRREQQLQVFNRVLRHNLRNDMTPIRGFADLIRERTTDPDVAEYATLILENTDGLIETGEKIRHAADALEDGDARWEIKLRSLVDDVAESVRSEHDGSIDVDIAEPVRLRTNPGLLRLVLSNLLENALVHHDGEPAVEIALVDVDAVVATIEIRDDGPGIPDLELDTLAAGGERALQHTQGVGLWIVTWGVESLGGELRFETDGNGTTVGIELPGVVTGGGGETASPPGR